MLGLLQQNHIPYCYLDLKCELKMEQKHPVIQMALSFRDYPSLQTPSDEPTADFHEKMPPHRVRVLGGGSVLWAEVTLAVHLSGVELGAGIVTLPQPQWTAFLHTLLPAFLFLLPQFTHLLLPSSPSILYPGHCQPWIGYIGQAQL